MRRVLRHAATKREAQAMARAIREELLSPTKKPSPTVAAFSARWLDTHCASRGLRDRTRAIYILATRHIVAGLGRRRLDQVRGEVLARFVAGMDRLPSGYSRRLILRVLRVMLGAAKAWGELAEIPPMPRVKVADSEREFYPTGEVDRLLRFARNDRDRLLILLGADAGLRSGETRGLHWGDVDQATGRIHVRRQAGDRPTKSGKARVIPMTPRLRDALRAAPIRLGCELVVHGPQGGVLSPDELRRALRAAARRAELHVLPYHCLRHSFASNLLLAGTPLRVVSEWLGHSMSRVTEVYSHVIPGTGDEHIGVLDTTSRGTLAAPANSALGIAE